jgi:hypothetical protein
LFTDLADDFYSELESNLVVPFVPTDEKIVEAMLDIAGVNENDVLYDLGSGDGRIVVTAAKERNTRAIGIDMDPQRIEEAREYAGWTGVDYLVEFIEDDIFCAEFSDASVITMYLLQTVNLELRPRLLSELQPGTRIVSHAFDMGAWKADETVRVNSTNVYLWVVPADIEGGWQWQTGDGRRFHVELQQEFQELSGKAWIDNKPAELISAELRGTRLQLAIDASDALNPEIFTARFKDGQLLPLPDKRQNAAAIELRAWEKTFDGRKQELP